MKLFASALFMIGACWGQGRAAYLHGTVVDQIGASIARVPVVVSSRDSAKTCETESDATGRFECKLPPGRYTITAVAPGFYAYRRAAFELPEFRDTVLKLELLIDMAAVRAMGLDQFGDGPDVAIAAATVKALDRPAPQYESRVLGRAEVLIRYGTAQRDPAQLLFSGPHLMLTMDALTIYADQMSCTTLLRSCSAKGAVVVELGDERLKGTNVDVDLVQHTYLLTRQAQLAGKF